LFNSSIKEQSASQQEKKEFLSMEKEQQNSYKLKPLKRSPNQQSVH
jgi:hypothetical protein